VAILHEAGPSIEGNTMSVQMEMTDVAMLRRANPQDVTRMTRVVVESQRADRGAASRAIVQPSLVERWMRKAVIHDEVWVIEREYGEVAGVLALSGTQLDVLDVTPALRGKGFGRMLVDKAKARRPGGLRARMTGSGHDARRFLLHHGFTSEPSLVSQELRWRAGAPARDHRPFRIVWTTSAARA
jgi:GNAT superfamily N-acetyltransferase